MVGRDQLAVVAVNPLHLTWEGRFALIGYALRRLLRVPPAPDSERCFMRAPVAPAVHCPRRALEGSLWCARHAPRDEALR